MIHAGVTMPTHISIFQRFRKLFMQMLQACHIHGILAGE